MHLTLSLSHQCLHKTISLCIMHKCSAVNRREKYLLSKPIVRSGVNMGKHKGNTRDCNSQNQSFPVTNANKSVHSSLITI